MKSLNEILEELQELADPQYVSQMEHFGIKGAKALGIKNTVLKPYVKEIGKNQGLANALWNQGIHECKHLAILLTEPKLFTGEIAEKWTSECYSWDLVDGIGMKIIPKTDFAYDKIPTWSRREPEFEKRMAFASMVGLTIHDKNATNDQIATFLPVIEREAWDERNFVRKAVNWALRQIGKRNLTLNNLAIDTAERIYHQDSKSARWIASDALRELRSDKILDRLRGKS